LKKPIILHCINSLGVGGAEVLLKDTISQLINFDHVICFLRKPDGLAHDFKNSTLYNLEHTSWWKTLNTCIKIRRIIRKHRVDIVHSHLFDATLLARLAVSKNISFFFTVHNILSKDAFEINRFSAFIERLTYTKNQTIIAVSKEVLRDYDEWIGIKGKSHVLYNYVSQKFFDLTYNDEQTITGDFKLIAVGNFRRQKNYFNLLNAFSLVKELPVSLEIYGSGNLRDSLQQKIDEEGLNVRLMGSVTDISSVLMNYHAYIMASSFEGFGIAPMEAMATGMPVLLSEIAVFKELANDIPVYFDPNNSASIADAIKNTYEHWQHVKSKTRGAKEIIYRKASQEVYVKKLVEIYMGC